MKTATLGGGCATRATSCFDGAPLVYVCSAFSGDMIRNTVKTRAYCRFVVDNGRIPLAPHLLLPQFMSEEKERSLALFMGIVLLGKCEEVWVFGNRVSEGMAGEIERAQRMRKRIRYFTDEMEEVDRDEHNA